MVPPSVFSIRGDQVLKIKPAASNAPFPMINTYPHGMPLGGLGAGTFSISPLGHFNVWHFFPGIHIFNNQTNCFFSTTQKVLGGNQGGTVYEKKLQQGSESNDLKAEEIKFSARYPLAWHEFNAKNLPVQLTLNSFSPVIAHNYQESSYPVAVFNWHAKNKSREKMMVSIKFQFGDVLSLEHEIDKKQSGPVHHFVEPKKSYSF
jgi:non-lysosomal glucosylceramidase